MLLLSEAKRRQPLAWTSQFNFCAARLENRCANMPAITLRTPLQLRLIQHSLTEGINPCFSPISLSLTTMEQCFGRNRRNFYQVCTAYCMRTAKRQNRKSNSLERHRFPKICKTFLIRFCYSGGVIIIKSYFHQINSTEKNFSTFPLQTLNWKMIESKQSVTRKL